MNIFKFFNLIYLSISSLILYEIPPGTANTSKLNDFKNNVTFQIECRSILSKDSCNNFPQCYYIEKSSYSSCQVDPCHENNFDSSSTCSSNLNCMNLTSNNDEYCSNIKVPCIDCPQCVSDPVCVDENVDDSNNPTTGPTSSPTFNPTTSTVELNYIQNFKGNKNELEQFYNASADEMNTLSLNGNTTIVHLDPTFKLIMKTLITKALNISMDSMIIDRAILLKIDNNNNNNTNTGIRHLNLLYIRRLQRNSIELQIEYTIISRNEDAEIVSQVISKEASGDKLVDDMIIETQDNIKYGNNTSSWSFDSIEADVVQIENGVVAEDSRPLVYNKDPDDGILIGTIIGAFFFLLLIMLAILIVYYAIRSNKSHADTKSTNEDNVDTAYNKAFNTNANANAWSADTHADVDGDGDADIKGDKYEYAKEIEA